MASLNPYLNFDGNTEEAFNFYKSVFGGEFAAIMRISDMPPQPGAPALPENEKNRIMHISLPIGKGTVLMASDILPSMGHKLTVGNNFYISIDAESKDEADRIFNALSAGGKVEMPISDMFWGSYWGAFKDKFNIQWMVSFSNQQ